MDSNEKEDLKVAFALITGAASGIVAIIGLAVGAYGFAFDAVCVGGIPAIYLIYKLFPL